jgi:hypothetical protein
VGILFLSDVVAFMIKTLVPLFLLVLVVFATLFFPLSLTKERTTLPTSCGKSVSICIHQHACGGLRWEGSAW